MKQEKANETLVQKVLHHPVSKIVIMVGSVAVTVALLGVFFKLIDFTAKNYKNLQDTIHRKIVNKA